MELLMPANILYIVRILLVGMATCALFIQLKLFPKMNNKQVMTLAIGITPMTISLINYILGLFFVGWSGWLYYLLPVILSCVWIGMSGNYRTIKSILSDIAEEIITLFRRIGKWILLDGVVIYIFCILNNSLFENSYSFWIFYGEKILPWVKSNLKASIVIIVIVFGVLSGGIFQMKREKKLKINLLFIATSILLWCIVFMGVSFNIRPVIDSDRAHYELEASYFCEDKNSWEIDNYKDEKYGSSHRDDHGPLWITSLADGRIIAEIVGLEDTLNIVNAGVFWIYLCFNMLLYLSSSYITKNKSSGILSLLLFHLYIHEMLMLLGSRDGFRLIGLLLLFLYLVNNINDVIEGKIKKYTYGFMALFCYLSVNGHQANVFVMLGIFLLLFIYMVVMKCSWRSLIISAIAVLGGTICGMSKTIRIYIETGNITSATSLAFQGTPVIEQLKQSSNQRADWSIIKTTYTNNVMFMIWMGIVALIIMLICSALKKEKELFIAAIIIAGMLLPMTGIMDWIGYECSLWFAEQLRYRMYFLMLFAITGGWLLAKSWSNKIVRFLCNIVAIFVFTLWISTENKSMETYHRYYIESGNMYAENMVKLAEYVTKFSTGNVFTANQVLLYYLDGTPKLLYHTYSKDLLQAKTEGEVEDALEKLDVGAIILPDSGVEYHDYSLLPFWDYINTNLDKEKIKNSSYVIYYNKDVRNQEMK